MHTVKFYRSMQFAVWRILFGLFLLIYFLRLLPYSKEIYSSRGILVSASSNLSYNLFPGPLSYFDSPDFIIGFMIVLILLSICFTIGFYRRIASFLLWFGWFSLFNRNNFTIDPSMHFIGWLLLAAIMIPSGEPLSVGIKNKNWNMNNIIYYGAWIILGAAFMASGIEKLASPSWVDGSALSLILQGFSAKDNLITGLFLLFPPIILQLMTWFSIFVQISVLPLMLFRKTKFLAWSLLFLMFTLIVFTFKLPEIEIAMLIYLLFVFDGRWIREYPILGKISEKFKRVYKIVSKGQRISFNFIVVNNRKVYILDKPLLNADLL